jgi:hypothetical protein
LVTDRVPAEVLVTPAGTVTVREVVVAAVGVAAVPPKETELLAAVPLKPVPVIVTVAPWAKVVGENEVMVGATPMVSDEELVEVVVPLFTVMVPVVAPAGTVTTNWVALPDVTVAVVPFIWTVLLAAVALKPVPVMVTDEPTAAEVGLNDEIA